MRILILLFAVLYSTFAVAGINPSLYRTSDYLPLLKDKRVGVVANHCSLVGKTHLIDTLLSSGINVTRIFAPEHGFRGNESAGANISHSIDTKTGINIFSLHGATKSPSDEVMKDIDIMLFDLQDVGLRFYTYISTLYYVMGQSAKFDIPLVLLDRPNPNAHYVDGPVLDMKHKSFVGMYPIPVVYGMTIGELAQMINGEKWLENGMNCDLTVVELQNYTHDTPYSLPVAPSPNLPNDVSILLYPNLCLFEATPVSVGRGTKYPFQQYGSPQMTGYEYSFVPQEMQGAKKPPCKGQKCYGVLLADIPQEELMKGEFSLEYIIDAYNAMGKPQKFFTPFLEKLIGVDYVREMIEEGKTNNQIKLMWQKDIEKFKILRAKYLLYK